MTDKLLINRELLERLLYSNSPARFDATEYNAARAELFAILAQPAQQGEAVEVVGYRFFHVDHGYIFRRTHIYEGNPSLEARSLMTVAQHQRILAAATRQADQVADDFTMVKVSRELLERAALLLQDSLTPPAGCSDFDDWAEQGNAVAAELRALLASAEGVKDE